MPKVYQIPRHQILNVVPIDIRDQNFNKFKINFKNIFSQEIPRKISNNIFNYFLLCFTMNNACTHIFFSVLCFETPFVSVALAVSYCLKMLQRLFFWAAAWREDLYRSLRSLLWKMDSLNAFELLYYAAFCLDPLNKLFLFCSLFQHSVRFHNNIYNENCFL